MANLKDIKRRMKATANMQQITRAMEAVSASKMRKSQMVALGARPYSVKAIELLGNLGETTKDHPLFKENKSNKTGILVVASDKGLCGGYNSAVLRKTEEFFKKTPELTQELTQELIVVGKKAINYFRRRNYEITAEFTDFGDYVEVEETSPVARLIMDRFKKGKYREVWIAYTNFISTLKQESVVRRILPIDLGFIKEIIEGIVPEYGRFSESMVARDKRGQSPPGTGEFRYEYLLEPNPKEIFKTLIPSLFEVAIHHIILESNASEHSARMVAMRNASENASDILDELTLSYNKARQAGITKELLEVVAGKEALED